MATEDPAAVHAQARSAVYALFSRLVASPFDAPSPVEALPPSDLTLIADDLRARLPFDFDLGPLALIADDLDDDDAERLAADYSALFEVSGAQVPLREELSPMATDKAKEETVRFYQHFGYALAEDQQWAPDHLSVQLEFIHFLAFKESQEKKSEPLASYRLAQRDFLDRHLCGRVPWVLGGVRQHSRESYWIAVFSVLAVFLDADAAWLGQTVAAE